MKRGDNFYGFGSKSEYVRLFASRGIPIAEIAATLGQTVMQLMADCPDLDFYQYKILISSNSYPWTNEEIRALVENYGKHGAKWDGWRNLLRGKSTRAIWACAGKLGLTYKGGHD